MVGKREGEREREKERERKREKVRYGGVEEKIGLKNMCHFRRESILPQFKKVQRQGET